MLGTSGSNDGVSTAASISLARAAKRVFRGNPTPSCHHARANQSTLRTCITLNKPLALPYALSCPDGMIGVMPETLPPPGIDVTKPNIARVYDYWLGGKDNFAADRKLAEQLLVLDPGMRDLVRGNRQFLCAASARAAREGGISQFLDLGAGLPVSPAVPTAARDVIPNARFT